MIREGPFTLRLRITVLIVLVLSMVTVLVLRLYFLQVLVSEEYAEAAESNRVRFIPVEPTRGRVLDRNGNPLIDNRHSNVIAVRLEDLQERELTIQRLAGVLGVASEEIEGRLTNPRYLPYVAIPVAEDVSEEVVVFIAEHQDDFPGVEGAAHAIRVYPFGSLAAHVLGYTGEITSEQLDLERFTKPYDYRPGTIVGRTGVEEAYEEALRGEDGVIKQVVDAQGRVVDSPRSAGGVNTVDPVPGADLITSINLDLQRVVEQSLAQGILRARSIYDEDRKKNFLAPGGAVVVLDPRNGEVLSMASFPTFDPGVFIGGISQVQFDELLNHPDKPLLNRPAQGEFPPGSTFKVVTAAAALEDGIASRGGRYPCPQQVRLFDQTFRNWRSSDAGSMTVAEALGDSCNTVFQAFGADFYRRFNRGQGERLQDFARAFGFDSPTGYEPAELDGRIPDETWLKTQHQRFPKAFPYDQWLPGYTINMAFGQGDVNVTPLQLAVAYSAIANGGRILSPHVGLRVVRDERVLSETQPKELGVLPISEANLRTIQRGLESVPTSGTGRFVFSGSGLHKFGVAGKTGSAQVQTSPPKQPISWFAAYAPINDPQFVVITMVEEAGAGSQTAAPITKRILESIFGLPLTDYGPVSSTD